MKKAISDQLSPGSVPIGIFYLILFIIWPFLAFIIALLTYSRKEARTVVFFFLVYFGLNFVYENVFVDASRYVESLRQAATLPISDFSKSVTSLYSDTTVDIVEPFVTFIISRFTINGGVFYAVWAAIFAFFYLKSVNSLHDRYQLSPGTNALIFMAFFVLIQPVTKVGGIRMPIATWIFFLGAYHLVLYRDPKYLLLTLASCLVHWSFLTANALLLIYLLAGNRNLIYFPIVIVSFILPQVAAPYFESTANNLGGAFQNRYEGYSSEGYIQNSRYAVEDSTWFVELSDKVIFYYLIAAILIIYFFSRQYEKEKSDRNLFSFLLLLLAFVNFGAVIPTFGGRFQVVFNLFATLYIFLHALKMEGNKLRFITWAGLFPMALYVIVLFRVDTVSINAFIFSPGLGVPLLTPAISLAEVLFF
jgi:hypothetical protein